MGATTPSAIFTRVRTAVHTGAAWAFDIWIRLARDDAGHRLPPELVEQIMSAIEARRTVGLNLLLQCARRLVEEASIMTADQQRLVNALGDLIIEADYRRIDPESWAAVTVSLVRAECVRLAAALQASGQAGPEVDAWLESAAIDPLSEVRFALDDDPRSQRR